VNKDNPACYECPKAKSGIHFWQIHRSPDGKIILGANCTKCDLFLNKSQTEDMVSER
jgi:hypothetical protein